MRYAFDAYEPLLRAAGNEALIQRDGRLFIYETEAGFRNAQASQERRREKGIEVQALSGDEVREIEPALGPSVRFGHFLPEGGISINPQHMIQVLARSLEQRGGTIVRDSVTGFEIGPDGPRRILNRWRRPRCPNPSSSRRGPFPGRWPNSWARLFRSNPSAVITS